jgi:hypothetical protein
MGERMFGKAVKSRTKNKLDDVRYLIDSVALRGYADRAGPVGARAW